MLESLEFRKLLSSSLSSGTLSIVGTGAADHVDVTKSGSNFVVDEHNGQAPKSYSSASVSLIKVDVKDGNDVVTIAADVTTPASLIGGNGADSLTGGAGNDTFAGNAGVDTLRGGGGNDVIGGGGSSDSVDGGSGDDTIDYSGRSSPIDAALLWQENPQTFQPELHGGGGQTNMGEQDSYLAIETIRGGTGNDSLDYGVVHPIEFGLTESPRILLDGGAGNDVIHGAQDAVLRLNTEATLKGGDGNDTIRYGFGAGWHLVGDAGDDTFEEYSSGGDGYPLPADGGPGFDTQIDHVQNAEGVVMGPGLEKAIVSNHNSVIGNDLDNIIEVSGANRVEGRGGNDRIIADECSTVSGGSGDDTIVATQSVQVFGDDGDDDVSDVVQPSAESTIDGGAGNDTLHGGPANDNFVGGAGNDTADFSDRGYSLNVTLNDQPDDGPRSVPSEHDNVHSDIENVLGGRGNDLIVGNPFANKLVGNAGNDTIWGGGGNDMLEGGTGSDQLFGQEGDDQLLAKDSTRDTVDGGAGNDSAQRDAGVDVVNSVERVS